MILFSLTQPDIGPNVAKYVRNEVIKGQPTVWQLPYCRKPMAALGVNNSKNVRG